MLVGTEVIDRVTVLNLTLVGSVIFNFFAFLTGGEEVSAGVFDAYLTLTLSGRFVFKPGWRTAWCLLSEDGEAYVFLHSSQMCTRTSLLCSSVKCRRSAFSVLNTCSQTGQTTSLPPSFSELELSAILFTWTKSVDSGPLVGAYRGT